MKGFHSAYKIQTLTTSQKKDQNVFLPNKNKILNAYNLNNLDIFVFI